MFTITLLVSQLPFLNRVLSSVGELTIASIVRCQAGTYTCVTAPPNPEDSTSTSVEVVVICEFTYIHNIRIV